MLSGCVNDFTVTVWYSTQIRSPNSYNVYTGGQLLKVKNLLSWKKICPFSINSIKEEVRLLGRQTGSHRGCPPALQYAENKALNIDDEVPLLLAGTLASLL